MLWAWGSNEDGQCGGTGRGHHDPAEVRGLPPILAVVAGQAHSAALSSAGDLFTWGSHGEGCLGIGEEVAPFGVPMKVDFNGGRVISVSSGDIHMAAIVECRNPNIHISDTIEASKAESNGIQTQMEVDPAVEAMPDTSMNLNPLWQTGQKAGCSTLAPLKAPERLEAPSELDQLHQMRLLNARPLSSQSSMPKPES